MAPLSPADPTDRRPSSARLTRREKHVREPAFPLALPPPTPPRWLPLPSSGAESGDVDLDAVLLVVLEESVGRERG